VFAVAFTFAFQEELNIITSKVCASTAHSAFSFSFAKVMWKTSFDMTLERSAKLASGLSSEASPHSFVSSIGHIDVLGSLCG